MPRSPADIGKIFRKEYNGMPNFMTPTLVRFGEFDKNFIYEVSQGKGMEFNSIMFGLTILQSTPTGWTKRHDLNKNFNDTGQVNNYINSLAWRKEAP